MSPIVLKGTRVSKLAGTPAGSGDTTITGLAAGAAARCQKAVPPVAMGDCEYYQRRHDDFRQRHEGCGHLPPHYYLGYGKKYCVRFSTELRPKLSPIGKGWLDRARGNLQRAIEAELPKQPTLELDGEAFRSFAFATHADAYWSAGLHELPIKDKARIALTPDAKEWLSSSTWSQAGDVAMRDAGAYASDAKKAMGEKVDEMAEELKQVPEDIRQYFRDLLK